MLYTPRFWMYLNKPCNKERSQQHDIYSTHINIWSTQSKKWHPDSVGNDIQTHWAELTMSQENLARNHTMQTAACTSIVSLENNSEQSGHSTKADGESSVYSSNTGATSGKT